MKYIISESKMRDLIFNFLKFYFKEYEFYHWESPTTGKNYKIMDDENGEPLLIYNIDQKVLVVTDKVIAHISNTIGPNESEILNSIEHWFENKYGFSPLVDKL